jgi:CubicO group peptidase (beta-lactamase class C family)
MDGVYDRRVGPEGSCREDFRLVRDALATCVESGGDVGCSVAVVHRGELVVDLWAGHLDEARTRPWSHDTVTCVFSTTKTMTALCALVLADQGELDVHAPIARYWPEFAAHGKDRVELRHVLAHTAGLPSVSPRLTVEDLYDWQKMTTLLAAEPLWWEPGTALGYHGNTQGYLVGEVVRRVTGLTLGKFFAEAVADPLGADFWIGTPAELDARIAPTIPSETGPELPEEGSLAYRAFTNPRLGPDVFASEAWRRAEIPSGNGFGNARSVALAQAAVSCAAGGLLSEAGRQTVFEVQAEGTDLVMGVPLRMGIGYGLNSELLTVSPNPRACFWGGSGGSFVVNDLDAELTIAYVMNRHIEGPAGFERAASMIMATYASLANLT